MRLGQIFLILLTPQQLISENLQIVAPSPTEAPGHRHRTQTIHRALRPQPPRAAAARGRRPSPLACRGSSFVAHCRLAGSSGVQTRAWCTSCSKLSNSPNEDKRRLRWGRESKWTIEMHFRHPTEQQKGTFCDGKASEVTPFRREAHARHGSNLDRSSPLCRPWPPSTCTLGLVPG